MYAQDTLTVMPSATSVSCDGKAIVNHQIVQTSWTWYNANGTQVIQTGGDTLKNLCQGDYMMKFFSTIANDTKTVRFHIGMGANPNPCANSTLNVTVNHISPSAPANCVGKIDLVATGGTTPYNFMLSMVGATSVNSNNPFFRNVCPGTYNVTLSDNAGCNRIITVNVPDSTLNNSLCANSTLNINSTNISLNTSTVSGSCNGSVEVMVSGGVTPYSYALDNGVFSQNNLLTGVCGTHNIQVKDANGCMKNTSVTVGNANNNGGVPNNGRPCQAFFKANPLDASGFKFHFRDSSRVDVGTITSFIWKLDGQIIIGTTSSIDHLFTGGRHSISLTITSSNNCIDTYIDSTDFPNFGNNNNGTSANCLNSNLAAMISGITPTSTATTCTGEISINATGGTLPYHFTLRPTNGGILLNSNDPHFVNLCTGGYIVTINDNTGCSKTLTCFVPVDTTNHTAANCVGSSLAASITSMPALSAATCNGKILIYATGGQAPYKYSADNGATIVTHSDFINLCAGNYNLGVEDNTGCVIHLTGVVQIDTANQTGPNPCLNSTIAGLVSSVVRTLPNSCVGKIAIDAHGGAFPYHFILTGSTGSMTSNDPHFVGLCSGNYDVKIIDSLGCSKLLYATVPVDSVTNVNLCVNSTLSATVTTVNSYNTATCNGMIDVVATGGQAPYNYSADNGITVVNISNIKNLCEGTYDVIVKDAIGCNVHVSATVVANATRVNADPCNGTTLNGHVSALTPTATDSTCTGKFYINATGGRMPYHFNVVNNGGASGNALAVTTPFFSNLCAGNYTAIIVDSAGCIKSFPVLVPVDSAGLNNPCRGSNLAITFVSTNSTTLANGTCNGGLEATVTGAANYTYMWSNNLGTTSLTQVGLCPGIYKLTVNANGCLKTESAVVNVGAVANRCTGSTLNGQIIYTIPTTAGASVGKLGVYATGGAIPYQYLISSPTVVGTPVSNSNFTNLAAGTYSVTIIDSLGCIRNFIGRINEVAVPVNTNPCLNSTMFVSMDATNVSDQGGSDGVLVATVSGAVNYTYTWSNNLGSSNLTQTGLTPGIYKLRVTSNGCSIETIGRVGINTPTNPCVNSTLTVSLTSTNETGVNINDGTIAAVAAGGVSPYTFQWSNGATTALISSLPHDTYRVYVFDAQGCSVTSTGIVGGFIPAPIALTGYVIPTGEVVANGCDGSASAIVYGGTAPYTFLYSNNSTEANTSYLCGGLQSVTIVDAVNDTLVINFIITSPANTIINTNPIGTPPVIVDSCYAQAISNCLIDLAHIVSAQISSYTMIGTDSVSVVWTIVDVTNVSTLITNVYALSDSAGVFLFAIQLYCPTKTTGQFLTAYDQLQITTETTGGGAGISEIKKEKNVGIYPNPFREYVMISLDNDQASEIIITDIAGKTVVRKSFNDKLIKIDMNELSAGSYIVTVRNNNQVTTKQIVK